jgi:hypothetical protein
MNAWREKCFIEKFGFANPATIRDIPEDQTPQCPRSGNLKSRTLNYDPNSSHKQQTSKLSRSWTRTWKVFIAAQIKTSIAIENFRLLAWDAMSITVQAPTIRRSAKKSWSTLNMETYTRQALVLVHQHAFWGRPEMETARSFQMLVPIHQFK